MRNEEKTAANPVNINTMKSPIASPNKNGSSIIAKFFDQRTQSLISLSNRPRILNSNVSPQRPEILLNPQPKTAKSNTPGNIFTKKPSAPDQRNKNLPQKPELKNDFKVESQIHEKKDQNKDF